MTGDTCPACNAPKITITTKKGPWTICIDPECPEKVASGAAAGWKRGAAGRKPAAKKPAAKKVAAKKPAAKKPAKKAPKKPDASAAE